MSIRANADNNFDGQSRKLLPIRWSAPETFGFRSFSEKSDVYDECLVLYKKCSSKSRWSFGVTVWEIFSFGEIPYKEIATTELQKFLNEGNRLKMPVLCEKLYE